MWRIQEKNKENNNLIFANPLYVKKLSIADGFFSVLVFFPGTGIIEISKYAGGTDMTEKLPLPVGVSDYRLASEEYYYVDKTLMLKTFLDERPMVSLFTRPRRFGKTLNMDMLRTYFEKTDEDTSVYFKDKKIWECGERYRSYQGKYPVIFLSFKDVKQDNWKDTYEQIIQLIIEEYQRHSEILDNNICNEYEKAAYQKIVRGTATNTEYMVSLKKISEILSKRYGENVIIIIDEYDTPIQLGYLHGFYDQVVSFMRNFFSGGFKDNRHLAFGFLTGILRVVRESIFSGLNNLVVNSVLDKKYSEYFGFTRAEVAEMASYYNVEDKLTEICDWYDGYRFGNTEIFNPWSVINYFSNDCEARSYWVSTSSNDIIGEVLKESDDEIWENLANFLQGEKLLTYIDTSVVYPQIKQNPSSVYSFLLMSGYLKIAGKNQSLGAGYMCEVGIPNREIMFVYQKEILDQLSYMIPQSASIGILEAVYTGNTEILGKRLNKLLKTTVSYYDTAQESFYHGLMLGLLAMTDDRYRLLSNDESGDGCYDICLIPRQKNLPGIIIELKAEKKRDTEELKILAEKAIEQIEEKHYDMQLKEEKVEHIIKYGVAFSGKNAEVVMKEN